MSASTSSRPVSYERKGKAIGRTSTISAKTHGDGTRIKRGVLGIGALIALAAGLPLALALDRSVYDFMQRIDGADPPAFIDMLNIAGYFPTWVVVAIVLLVIDIPRLKGQRVRRITERFELLLWPPIAAGLIAGGLKLLIRRERPVLHDGAYVFRPWDEFSIDVTGLGMPSSHAAVAFSVATILTKMEPWPVGVWIFLALGCGFARLVGGAHFLSDVYVGGVLGVVCALGVWRIHVALKTRAETAGP